MQLAHLLHHKKYKTGSMKKISKNIYSIAAIIIVFTTAACNSAKKAANATATTNAITLAVDSSKWKFIANQVMPQYGNARQANGDYDTRLNKDNMIVYLPYFGKADAGANFTSGKGPLDFTTTNFTIEKKQNRKGLWVVTITPNDNREVRALNYTFSPGGFATLSVTMSNRTGISFSGTVVPLK